MLLVKPWTDKRERLALYCGDCLTVLPALDQTFDALVIDPPYSSGGAYRSDRTQTTLAKYVRNDTISYRPEFGGDNRDQRSYFSWSALWLTACYHRLTTGALAAVFTDWRQLPTTTDALQAAGFTWRGIAVWSKKYGRPMPGRYSNACEYVVWGSKGPMPAREIYAPGIFECAPHAGPTKTHIAQKPDPVMRWLLSILPENSLVLDPFAGSGATLRAARALGHRAIGIENDPDYCAKTIKSLAQELLF